jgi:hypothetical protein
MKNLFVICCLFIVSCTGKPENQEVLYEKNPFAEPIVLIDSATINRISKLESQTQAQDSAIRVLVKHAMYSDSLLQDRQKKSDRAEKRGRFWGGVLKGLIPGLNAIP